MDLPKVSQDWTLFLDRDGVINYEKKEDYIYNWEEFKFYEDALMAISRFSKIFGRIVIVTNQKGVGKGLMNENDLILIHKNMVSAIEKAGGRIDEIYYCTSTDNNHLDRKPQPGMAYKAKVDFPEIDFSKSLMVGNNISDMEFGRNAGIKTVFLRTTKPNQEYPHPSIDFIFDNLEQFSEFIC